MAGFSFGGFLVLLKVFFLFIFGLSKVPFGDYFLFFLGFLSKSKDLERFWVSVGFVPLVLS